MGGRRLAAGAVVLRSGSAGWAVLILRCYRNWDFPKGMVEAGEEPLAAARREVTEETSLAELAFPWGPVWRETEPYARGKVARFYLAVSGCGDVHLPVSPELGRPEHHEWRWADFETANRLLPPRLQTVLAWARALCATPPGASS